MSRLTVNKAKNTSLSSQSLNLLALVILSREIFAFIYIFFCERVSCISRRFVLKRGGGAVCVSGFGDVTDTDNSQSNYLRLPRNTAAP